MILWTLIEDTRLDIETKNGLLLSNNGGQLISIVCTDSSSLSLTEQNEDGQMVSGHMMDCIKRNSELRELRKDSKHACPLLRGRYYFYYLRL